jgi:hypothetical protein
LLRHGLHFLQDAEDDAGALHVGHYGIASVGFAGNPFIPYLVREGSSYYPGNVPESATGTMELPVTIDRWPESA